MTSLERAKQFMPFSALHGYEDIIKKQEFTPAVRRELSEEETEYLNKVVSSLKKGDMAEATYYSVDRYIKTEGAVSEVNLVLRYICIVKTKISFDDLASVKVIK